MTHVMDEKNEVLDNGLICFGKDVSESKINSNYKLTEMTSLLRDKL